MTFYLSKDKASFQVQSTHLEMIYLSNTKIRKEERKMNCKKEETLRRGPWLEEEDERLLKFVTLLGERRWDSLARVSGTL